MARKFKITEEVKQEIISYCEGLLVLLNNEFLKENEILENEFLEYLYTACEGAYLEEGKIKLTTQEIIYLIERKKENDFFISEVEAGEAILTDVDKNDNLFFVFKEEEKKIKNEQFNI